MARKKLRQQITKFFSKVILDGMKQSKKLRPRLLRWAGAKIGAENVIRHIHVHGGSFHNLSIGRGCWINKDCIFNLDGPIKIGNNVDIGFGAVIITSDHELGNESRRCGTFTPTTVTIGDGAWLGAYSIIHPGVEIGKGSIVSAGSVVSRSMPENMLIAGNPARAVQKLEVTEESISEGNTKS
jgi:maltose O-acetyltransferase